MVLCTVFLLGKRSRPNFGRINKMKMNGCNLLHKAGLFLRRTDKPGGFYVLLSLTYLVCSVTSFPNIQFKRQEVIYYINFYSFALSCGNGPPDVCVCKPNYIGDDCGTCGPGYYGEPNTIGR